MPTCRAVVNPISRPKMSPPATVHQYVSHSKPLQYVSKLLQYVSNKPFVYRCVSITHAVRIPMLLEWPLDKTFTFADCRWMKGFGYTLRFFCFTFFLGFWLYVWFLLFSFPCIWLLLYTGAFEQMFIWATKAKVRLYLYDFVFCFCFFVVAACVWFRILFLLLLCFLVFFPTLHRCIWRRKVDLNNKGALFFYFPCVTLTRIGFLFFFFASSFGFDCFVCYLSMIFLFVCVFFLPSVYDSLAV